MSDESHIRPAPVSTVCRVEGGRTEAEKTSWAIGIDGAPGCVVVPEWTSRMQVAVEREESDVSRLTLNTNRSEGLEWLVYQLRIENVIA